MWLLLGCAPPCAVPYDGSAPGSPEFAAFVEEKLDVIGAPGATVGLLRDRRLGWAGGFGTATPDADAEADTIWMLASVSKLVTAAAVHELAAEGLLDLDAPVGDVLPFPVDHPSSDVPITAAMLLEHTSALRDNDPVIWGHYAPGDPTEPLEHWLRDVLVPGGAHYSADKNFAPRDPGEEREYANTGYALLGQLVASTTGEPFDRWCHDHLFVPLGMTDTAWMLADLPEERIARPYLGGLFGPEAHAHYGYPDCPDGQLRTTVADFARFLGMLARGGEDEQGQAVLLPDAARRLWDQGMGTGTHTTAGHRLRGHNGSDRGVRTEAWLGPDTGRDYLLFLNRRVHTDRQREALQCLTGGLVEAAFADDAASPEQGAGPTGAP